MHLINAIAATNYYQRAVIPCPETTHATMVKAHSTAAGSSGDKQAVNAGQMQLTPLTNMSEATGIFFHRFARLRSGKLEQVQATTRP